MSGILLYLRSTASGVVSANASIHQLNTAPGASVVNDGTSFSPASTTNYNVGPGANSVQTPNGTISGNGKGWIYDTAISQVIQAGTWTVSINYNCTEVGCLSPTATLIAEVYQVTATTTAVTSVSLIGTASTGSISLQENLGDTQISATFSGVQTTFIPGQYIYAQFFLESNNPHSCVYANRADNPTLTVAGQIQTPANLNLPVIMGQSCL